MIPDEVSPEVREELRAYGTPLLAEGKEPAALPLPDEPQLVAWTRYSDAAKGGAYEALAQVFPQLRFPIQKGMSEVDSYRAATRRGESAEDADEATGLVLSRRDLVNLSLQPTIAGRIPILVAGDRGDFESFVRAFSARNEPVDVPTSMGACLVRGLNDWERIRQYRRAWEESHPFGDWSTEFQALVPQKELYEDRFIILSTGPYSGVPAERAGFPEDLWRELSLSIRREHEATHYFTLRAAGTMRTNFIDELVADFVGLVRTFGRYREDLALLFFGLEDYPAYREGARLQNYRGKLSDAAFDVAKGLAHGAVKNMARLDAARPARGETGIAHTVLSLATASLEELASADLVARVPPSPSILTVEAETSAAGVEATAEKFRDWALEAGVPRRAAADMELVVDEVLSNKVKYGGGSFLAMEGVAKDGFLSLEFVDDGKPFDETSRPAPDTTGSITEKPIGGLGILLVRRLTDEQRYERTGAVNRLVVKKRLG